MNKKILYTAIAALSLTMAQGASAAAWKTTFTFTPDITINGAADSYTGGASINNVTSIDFLWETAATTGTVTENELTDWSIKIGTYTDDIIIGGVVQNLGGNATARTLANIDFDFNLDTNTINAWDSFTDSNLDSTELTFWQLYAGAITVCDVNCDTIFNRNVATVTTELQAVPIPAAAWLFGTGLAGLMAAQRRKKTQFVGMETKALTA